MQEHLHEKTADFSEPLRRDICGKAGGSVFLPRGSGQEQKCKKRKIDK